MEEMAKDEPNKMRGACQKCTDRPCELCRAGRALLLAWSMERRRQLGEYGYLTSREVPDQDALDAVLNRSRESHADADCDCSCHNSSCM